MAPADQGLEAGEQVVTSGVFKLRAGGAVTVDNTYAPDAKPEFRTAARFFARFRDLCASGYYTTPAGMKDIGYVGNVALERFDGPPPEVRRKLGLS